MTNVSDILVSFVAIINWCRVGGLKQQRFILSQLCKPEIPNQGVPMLLLPSVPEGTVCALPLPASGGYQQSLAWGHPSPVSASMVTLPPPLLRVVLHPHTPGMADSKAHLKTGWKIQRHRTKLEGRII